MGSWNNCWFRGTWCPFNFLLWLVYWIRVISVIIKLLFGWWGLCPFRIALFGWGVAPFALPLSKALLRHSRFWKGLCPKNGYAPAAMLALCPFWGIAWAEPFQRGYAKGAKPPPTEEGYGKGRSPHRRGLCPKPQQQQTIIK